MTDKSDAAVISLVRDMADFTSYLSFLLVMGAASERRDTPENYVADVTEQIRDRAGELTDSIQQIFGTSNDKLIRLSADAACDSIWDSAGITISYIEMQEIVEDDDE